MTHMHIMGLEIWHNSKHLASHLVALILLLLGDQCESLFNFFFPLVWHICYINAETQRGSSLFALEEFHSPKCQRAWGRAQSLKCQCCLSLLAFTVGAPWRCTSKSTVRVINLLPIVLPTEGFFFPPTWSFWRELSCWANKEPRPVRNNSAVTEK